MLGLKYKQHPIQRHKTYSASTVAADSPLCSHTLPSIDNKDLMLSCNLIFDLDGMFKLQHTEGK